MFKNPKLLMSFFLFFVILSSLSAQFNGFVEAGLDGKFYLDGEVFRFTGVNIRELALFHSEWQGDAEIENQLRGAAAMGARVIRFSAMHNSLASDNQIIEAIERILELAEQIKTDTGVDLKFIITFADFYAWNPAVPDSFDFNARTDRNRDPAFNPDSLAPHTEDNTSGFFRRGDAPYYRTAYYWNDGEVLTDPVTGTQRTGAWVYAYSALAHEWYVSGYKNNYLPAVRAVVSHFANHTYTRKIMAWETGNEMQCGKWTNKGADECRRDMLAFLWDVAETIMDVDKNRHLTTTGFISTWHAFNGNTDSDIFFDVYTFNGYYDFITVHVYNEQLLLNPATCQNVHNDIARAINSIQNPYLTPMPYIVEEAGVYGASTSGIAPFAGGDLVFDLDNDSVPEIIQSVPACTPDSRAETMAALLKGYFCELGSSGFMQWAFVSPTTLNGGDNGSGDASVGMDQRNFRDFDALHEVYYNTAKRISNGLLLDIVLVIDDSGSMTTNDASNLRRQAAELFIDQAQEGSRIGIVRFTTSTVLLKPLTLIRNAQDRADIKNAIILYSSGGTNLKAGLDRAFTDLEAHPCSLASQAVVFMTDGVDNYSVPSAAAYVQNYIDHQWPVFTVGLGNGVDTDLLREMAGLTNGEYYFAEPDNLGSIYSRIIEKLEYNSILSSLTGYINQGQHINNEFVLDSSLANINFVLTWPGSKLDLVLKDPAGNIIDKNTALTDSTVDYVEAATYVIYTLKHPAAGLWQTEITGTDVKPGGEPFNLLLSAESDVFSNFLPFDPLYTPGNNVAVAVKLMRRIKNTSLFLPVLQAPVTASVIRPDGRVDPFLLYDDGLHGDGNADDGIYANIYADTGLPGSYLIKAIVTAEDFTREIRETVQVGAYNTLYIAGSSLLPAPGSTTGDNPAIIRAQLMGPGGRVDATSIRLILDGAAAACTYNPIDQLITAGTGLLSSGRHNLTLDISDIDGNPLNQVAWSFTYNTPPQAFDDFYVAIQGGEMAVDSIQGVLLNDTDYEGDIITAVLVTKPQHGTVRLEADGSFIYYHDGSDILNDSFVYSAYDGCTASPATVFLTVRPLKEEIPFTDFSITHMNILWSAGGRHNRNIPYAAFKTTGKLILPADLSLRDFRREFTFRLQLADTTWEDTVTVVKRGNTWSAWGHKKAKGDDMNLTKVLFHWTAARHRERVVAHFNISGVLRLPDTIEINASSEGIIRMELPLAERTGIAYGEQSVQFQVLKKIRTWFYAASNQWCCNK